MTVNDAENRMCEPSSKSSCKLLHLQKQYLVTDDEWKQMKCMIKFLGKSLPHNYFNYHDCQSWWIAVTAIGKRGNHFFLRLAKFFYFSHEEEKEKTKKQLWYSKADINKDSCWLFLPLKDQYVHQVIFFLGHHRKKIKFFSTFFLFSWWSNSIRHFF